MAVAVRYAFHHFPGRAGQPDFFVCENLLRVVSGVQLVAEFKRALIERRDSDLCAFRAVVLQVWPFQFDSRR